MSASVPRRERAGQLVALGATPDEVMRLVDDHCIPGGLLPGDGRTLAGIFQGVNGDDHPFEVGERVPSGTEFPAVPAGCPMESSRTKRDAESSRPQLALELLEDVRGRRQGFARLGRAGSTLPAGCRSRRVLPSPTTSAISKPGLQVPHRQGELSRAQLMNLLDHEEIVGQRQPVLGLGKERTCGSLPPGTGGPGGDWASRRVPAGPSAGSRTLTASILS